MKSALLPVLSLFAIVLLFAVVFASQIGKAVAHGIHDALFGFMSRSGMVLGMAELNTVSRTKIAQVAGIKTSSGSFNKDRTLFFDTPAAWSAANGDTFGTGIVFPAGTRFRGAQRLSSAAGAASSTVSFGIRDAITKVAIDATALINAASIATAQEQALATGTKLVNGQFYVCPVDVEVYGTFGGATPQANQAIRAEFTFVAA